MTEEYDTATKAWTTLFGVMVMLLIQWAAFISPRMDSPPRDGNLTWTIVAAAVGLLAPLVWTADDLRRYRMGKPWLITAVPITIWIVISFFLVNR